MSLYNKPHLSFKEQLALLKSRGLIVTNDNIALEYLQRIGYYRLTDYLYPFRQLISPNSTTEKLSISRKDDFQPNSYFQHAIELYVFDKRLKLLLLDAIERIEIAFRVDIAYLLGKKDAFAHTNPKFLSGQFTKVTNPKTGKIKFAEWTEKHNLLVNRSKETFLTHYKQKYGSPLPIWVVIEIWDFGMLSTFYQGMMINDKEEIAKKYNIPNHKIMESWLRCLNYVRNVVAHHGRLWNKNFVDQPKMPRKGQMQEFDHLCDNPYIISRVYVAICILKHFMCYICPRSSWPKRVGELIHCFPNIPHVDIKNMGFPENWEKYL